jgi:flotillin
VEPAKASCGAAEENARASVASIIEDGKARADVLRSLAESWKDAGPNARDIFLLQKFDRVMPAITDVIAASNVDKLTIIDGRAPTLSGGNSALKALSTVEQIKEVLGVDVVERLNALGRSAD